MKTMMQTSTQTATQQPPPPIFSPVLAKVMAQIACVGVLALGVRSCSHAVEVENFGDPNIQRVWTQLSNLEGARHGETVRILQVGDSHTAGDYFSHVLRIRLQAQFGNAGYGWLTPGYVTNQRSAQVKQHMLGKWRSDVSKSNASAGGDFPLGGVVNVAGASAGIEIAPKAPLEEGLWRLTLWSKGSSNGGGWNVVLPDGQSRSLSTPYTPTWAMQDVLFKPVGDTPLRVMTSGTPSQLGGILLDRLAPGVSYDSLGIVGAHTRVLRNWNQSLFAQQLRWRKPDLIILAYGTNEAFDPRFNEQEYRTDLHAVVQLIRSTLPSAAILLVGAPSSAKKTGPSVDGGCGQYGLAPSLLTVQRVQREVAFQEHLLYWNWAEAMGGNCAIQQWAAMNPPLARADLVHLAPEGYEASAIALHESLMRLYRQEKLAFLKGFSNNW